MPLADMFWGDRYGLLKDKWGNRWSIATHVEDVPPDQMEKRMADAMKNFPT
jgi:PhnB protein